MEWVKKFSYKEFKKVYQSSWEDPWPVPRPTARFCRNLPLISTLAGYVTLAGYISQVLVLARFCLGLTSGRLWWETGGQEKREARVLLSPSICLWWHLQQWLLFLHIPAPTRRTCHRCSFFWVILSPGFYNRIFSLCLTSLAVAMHSFDY